MKAKCSARLLLHMIGAVMALLSHQNASAGQLQVSADFDNGRVKVINIDQQTRTIETTIPDDNHTQHTQMRYWHYRINGITPGELITIKHSPSTTSLYYAYSYDGKEWFRFGKSGINPIQHRFDSSSVELSPNFAYPYSRSIAFCDSIEALGLAHAQVSTLAISEEGREVKMLRITDPSVSDDTKRIVWIQGRQHAFESASSFIPEGFAQWMISNDAAGAEFRTRVIAYVIPIMDVDNVYKGMSGKDQPPVDFNRCWNGNPPHWKAVAAAKETLAGLCAVPDRLAAFFDSHSPYYKQHSGWHWRCNNWTTFKPLFVAAIGEIEGAPFKMDFHSNDPDGDINSGISAMHVRARWGTAPDYLGATMESSHFKDAGGKMMTVEGYRQWGEALGRAIYKHMGGKKTPDSNAVAVVNNGLAVAHRAIWPDREEPVQIRIMSLDGKCVWQGFGRKAASLWRNFLHSGAYLVYLKAPGVSHVEKLAIR